MLYLIDADIFCYRSASAAEQQYHWQEDDVWTLLMDMNDARDAFQTMVRRVTDTLGEGQMLFCLSDPNDNFRKRVCADYKGNRSKTRKPTGYKALVEWVKENYATAMRPAIEADDVMGIISSQPENEGKCIIVSDDKDMKTLKCKLYRPTPGEQLNISQADADRFFLTQCLTGDTADNIRGCPGYGPVKAERALGPRPSWGAVEKAYVSAGLTKEDALQQARLARILRHTEWDSEKGVQLWTP